MEATIILDNLLRLIAAQVQGIRFRELLHIYEERFDHPVEEYVIIYTALQKLAVMAM